MTFQKASGDPNSASRFGEKAAMQLQSERRADDLDILPLSERKRMLIHHDVLSKALNVKQRVSDFSKRRKRENVKSKMSSYLEWPGLPRGVKFDPSDEDLLWHLLAETVKGVAKRHPFINEFIISLDEDDGLDNVHPQFLPGVKQDGSKSYFFHKKIDMNSSRKLKRQKKHDNSGEIYWHSNGKLNLVYVDGFHQGFKEVFTLFMNPVNAGNPVRTSWVMHQYHISINGAEEDLIVSKLFYEMSSKPDIQNSQTDSVDGFVAEVVAVAAPLQAAPESYESLHVESVSAEALIQVLAKLTPAELTIEELSQKVVDRGIGGETKVKHLGYLKSASYKKYPTTYFETAAAKSEISVEEKKECVVGKRTDGFLPDLGDFGISINNCNYDEVICADKCDSNDAHLSMEKPCTERAPEQVLQKNVVNEMFKTQCNFIPNRSGEINKKGISSFSGHILREYEANSKFLNEAHALLRRISGETTINDLFVLGLPAYSLKGKPSEETKPEIALEKNSRNWVNISAQSDFPIKIEPKSFEEDAEIGFASASNRSNASASSGLLTKVKTEPFEGAEASSMVRILSTKLSGLGEQLSETNGLTNQHPEKDDNVGDDLLMSNENSQVRGDSECYPQINVHAGEPQSNSVLSSSSLNVKSEPLESRLLTDLQIYPSNAREHASLMLENKTEIYSDSALDIIDHIPLKYRLGVFVSEDDVNVKSRNISEEIALGSVNTKKFLSSSRRKRKKTATNSVEKAMEEDAPGLLKALLDRGIQIEEFRLYGGLEDNDPLETSSSEGSFEELETVMTKLFSERSSLLRLASGRPMKGARAIYCLACLISLIEQTRYLRFRQIPIDWGWCRELQSFIFVFQAHNRIVLERPEYGYATYFFEFVESLPIDWQVKRLITAMKLTNFCRTILLENKPLIVGEDLSEGEARVLEAYGWTRNTGFGTFLNFVDRVVHDNRNLTYSSEWRAKIGKMLMNGYDGGRTVLANIPDKVEEYLGRSSEIKMEL